MTSALYAELSALPIPILILGAISILFVSYTLLRIVAGVVWELFGPVPGQRILVQQGRVLVISPSDPEGEWEWNEHEQQWEMEY